MLIIIGDGGLDTDARNYISNVQDADGAYLEKAVKKATNELIVTSKQDGFFSAIKASCLLAGARTLAGALVPLVGTAPTNNGFVSADYNRKTGLIGDGIGKYLDSNRLGDADASVNHHISVYVQEVATIGSLYIGAASGSNGDSGIANAPAANSPFRGKSSGFAVETRSTVGITGFLGISRNNSNNYVSRMSAANETITAVSANGLNNNYWVFGRNPGSPSFVNARLKFYSIGESLNLALLDTRITTYMNTLNTVL